MAKTAIKEGRASSDVQIAQRLMAHLHRGGEQSYYWTLPDKRTYWHPVGQNGHVPAAPNVYFGVHPTRAARDITERARNEDVSAANCLFAEFDAKDRPFLNPTEQREHDRIETEYKAAMQVHKAAYRAWVDAGRVGNAPKAPSKEDLIFDLDAAKARALAHIRTLPKAPSVVVDSGGGFHCYWLLDETFIVTTEADRQHLAELQSRWVQAVGGDQGAKDLARVLRVPGTLNSKPSYNPPKSVTCIEAAFTLHTLAELEALAPMAPMRPTAAITPKKTMAGAAMVGQLSAAQIGMIAGEFNQKHNVADILTENGYDVAPSARNGCIDVARPGKTLKDGPSGNIKNGIYVNHSSNDPYLKVVEKGDHGYTAFAVWATFDHDGDEQAAARLAAAELGIELGRSAKTSPTEPLNERDVASFDPIKFRDQASRRTCDDIGNGYRFADQHRHHARYVDQWGWMAHDGKRWERDITGMVMRMAKQTVQSIWDEVKAAAEIAKNAEGTEKETAEKRVKQLTAHAAQSRSIGKLNAMLAAAQSEMSAKPEDFDKDPLLLNAQNGTIDLLTGKLRKHDPADMITKCCAANYTPGAPTPLWHATLDRFLPEHLQPYIKKSFGLTTSGEPIKAFWIFIGALGNNGKSTMTGTVANVLGDYAVKISIDVLTSKHRSVGDEDQIAHLAGARFALGNEVDSRALNEKLIKDLTGEMDTIRTKFFGVGTFEFKPQFKLFLYGNKRPELDATDQALWNRVQCVPFDRVIPKSEQIPNFAERLKAESDGILAWLVEGFLEYRRDGLNPPAEVVQAAADYRTEMDTFAQCIKECFVLNPSAFTKFADIKATVENFTGEKFKNPDLVKELKRQGFTQDRGAKGVRGWRGLGLIAEASGENDATVTEVTEVTAFSIRVGEKSQKPEPSGKIPTVASPLSPKTLVDEARALFAERGRVKISDITGFLDELSVKTGASEADCVDAYRELIELGELQAE